MDRKHLRIRNRLWPALMAIPLLLTGCTSAIPLHTAMPAAVPAVAMQTALPKLPTASPMASLLPRISTYLSHAQGTYGIYVIDLNSGATLGVNENRLFPAASTAKLPLAMYILERASSDKAILDETVTVSADDWQDGTGVLQEVPEGTSLRVKDLVELSITESDNIAKNMLVRRFGQDSVDAYMRKLGGSASRLHGLAGTTPKEMAMYMKSLFDGTGVTEASLRTFLLDALTHTAFPVRIAAGVPTGVTVAHKIGTLPAVVNDVGVVLAPERPFIIAVFSLDVAEPTAENVIAELTHMVLTELNPNRLSSRPGPSDPTRSGSTDIIY